jgi:hypothetical protein
MQRLNNDTLQSFVNERGVTAIMFGATDGEATMNQAIDFADAWLDCHDEAHFGYIDALENVAAARAYAVRVLPTTMIARDGDITAWIEGRSSSVRIGQAILSASRHHAEAA